MHIWSDQSASIGFCFHLTSCEYLLHGVNFHCTLLLHPTVAGTPRGGVSGGFVAALSGAGTPQCPPGHTGKTWSHPGGVQPLPHCLLPVPPATEILQHPLPASAVHDGQKRLHCKPYSVLDISDLGQPMQNVFHLYFDRIMCGLPWPVSGSSRMAPLLTCSWESSRYRPTLSRWNLKCVPFLCNPSQPCSALAGSSQRPPEDVPAGAAGAKWWAEKISGQLVPEDDVI